MYGHTLIEQFRAECSKCLNSPELRLVLDENWSSDQVGHRLQMRKYLLENFACDPSVMDLSRLPCARDVSISISHNRALGGIATVSAAQSVGLDIELSQRLNASNIRRVACDDNEVASAPGPDILWAAKEAAFKVLGLERQPLGLKDLEVGNWQEGDSGFFTSFLVRIAGQEPTESIRGLTARIDDQVISIFVMERDMGHRRQNQTETPGG